jgi:putative FmdB family regulatory protein
MPLYEYNCSNCGDTVEAVILNSEDEQKYLRQPCTICGKKGTKVRIMSAPGIAKLKTPAY